MLSESSKDWDEMSVSYPDFKDWQSPNRPFESLVGYLKRGYSLTGLAEGDIVDFGVESLSFVA